MLLATKGTTDDKHIATKLHKQFGHPSPKTLIKLLQNAGMKTKTLEKEVYNISENCITCIKYRKPFSRPVVCTPLAKQFNEMLGMDLKIWGREYFLVLVDIATRFCGACVISD